MDTGAEEGRETRQSGRLRTRTAKVLEQERIASNYDRREAWDHYGDDENETEDAINRSTVVLDTPRSTRSVIHHHIQMAPTKGKQRKGEKTEAATNLQIKMLTELVTSLLRVSEEQKQAQANHTVTLTEAFTQQIEALSQQTETLSQQTETLSQQTETFSRQIDKLRAENKELRELIQAQLPNIEASPSATPSYADIARTPPGSQPSNLRTLSSMNTRPSTMTDTLYCTVDTSRVQEQDQEKTNQEQSDKQLRKRYVRRKPKTYISPRSSIPYQTALIPKNT